jgi:hypothetical protein
VETNSTGGQGSRRAVAPRGGGGGGGDDDDDDDDDNEYPKGLESSLRQL